MNRARPELFSLFDVDTKEVAFITIVCIARIACFACMTSSAPARTPETQIVADAEVDTDAGVDVPVLHLREPPTERCACSRAHVASTEQRAPNLEVSSLFSCGVESEERVSVSNLESDVWVEAGSGFGMNRK